MGRWYEATVTRAGVVVALAAVVLSCGAANGAPVVDREPSSAAAASLPDLRPGPPSFSREGTAAIRVSVNVRNRGRGRARTSMLTLVLSRDPRRGGGDLLLGRETVRPLPARSSSMVRATLDLPSALQPGGYWVIACVDARRRVRESSESNNCGRSMTRLRADATSGDRDPPRFSGLVSATTCVPGPGGPGISSRYTLRWEPATDDATPQGEIVYEIYRAGGSSAQDFGRAAYTTSPGATSFATPPLPSDRPWRFVVRARNGAGDRDRNEVEVAGENICE